MGDFSFTATARCDKCGNYLDASGAECDHDGNKVRQYMFRRISREEGRPYTIAIRATPRWKWYALADELGEDWIAYEWIGPRESVQNMLGGMWEDIDDIPKRAMSLDAPDDVAAEMLEE